MAEVEKAVEHAYTLLREHVERYRTEILVEPTAWRTRCRELAENLDWLLFCRSHPCTPKQQKPKYPPPPPFRR